jgi:hypothetical protein
MKQTTGLVLALVGTAAGAAPALARDPAPEPRLPPDGTAGKALAGMLATAASAEAALAEGRAHLATGNAAQAISAFRQALGSEGSSVAALNGLGIAYDQLGRHDLARSQFEAALALEPEAADIAYNLGWSLHLAGDHRAAVPWLQRASSGDDGRAAQAARRALALIAARLEAEAIGPAPTSAPAMDAPARVASARIDMASTGEAVLVLPSETANPVGGRDSRAPVLALSVPVERVITASLPDVTVDIAAIDIDLPELSTAPDTQAPLRLADASDSVAPAPAADAARQPAEPVVAAARKPAEPVVAAARKPAESSVAAARKPAAVREVLANRLGALAALTIPLAVPAPAVAAAPAPPPLVVPAARVLDDVASVPAAQPRALALGNAPDFADLSADAPDWADPAGPPPLRLLDLAALPVLATATPMQPMPLLPPPRLAVDWMAHTDIDAIAPEPEAPAYKRLMDALLTQADLADAVDPRAVRMAINRLEALVARIQAMGLEVMRA